MKKRVSVGNPVLFWHSDPVLPDETVMLAGADFAASCVVELAVVVDEGEAKWREVSPEQWTEISLKAVIPAEWPQGLYGCRVRNGRAVSETVYLNAPDVWWKQGEGGVDTALAGSWLRLFGKCLDIEGGARLRVAGGPELELKERGCFALWAEVPADLPTGDYALEVSNGQGGEIGWRSAGKLTVRAAVPDTRPVFNVLGRGADPTGLKDCTAAIVMCLERAHALPHGGIVYFPRGRYRVDGILRSGTFMDSPLVLPENVSLRGEGADLTSLWWPTRETPLPSLIECRRGCSVEDLAIYSQGPRRLTITGDSEVTLRNLVIRANAYYMTVGPGKSHHGNRTPEDGGAAAISLWGDNNRILNCDVLVSGNVLDIRSGRGNVISGNRLHGSGTHNLSFCSEMIYENNTFEGSFLSTGGNIALHFGGTISKHIYYAGNSTRHLYIGDHECLTLDGHGCAYFGRVRDVDDARFRLAGPRISAKGKGGMRELLNTAVHILDGRGAGQYRFVQSDDAGLITIDRPWDVAPDAGSLITIGAFNGRHLIIGNTGEDVGTLVQLYPPNCECFVVGNRGIRTSNINSIGYSGTWPDREDQSVLSRIEVSWYNQFLDNEILVGNSWGGGTTHVDSWLGGEATLEIHGGARLYARKDNGDLLNVFQTPEWVAGALGEDTPREINMPISRFQIVRRHRIHNNSSIRIRGCVADAIVEHCRVSNSRRGIRVDMEVYVARDTTDLGMLRDYAPNPSDEHPALPFLRPSGVLLRDNTFENVETPYSGTSLETAKVVQKE